MTRPEWTLRTRAVVAGRPTEPGDPLNTPLVLASNYRSDTGTYARTHGTPTWEALEAALGELEGGRCVAFASGMAAASAVLWVLAPRVVVIPDVSYLGVRALLAESERVGHLTVRPVDVTDTNAVLTASQGADVVWVETPTNPTLDEADLAGIIAGRPSETKVVVDATFVTPLGRQPLREGADVVIHAATKMIGGHSDLLAGVASTTDDHLAERLVMARTLNGATPGALECFLALRGLRTLPLRLAAASSTARLLATRLRAHPAVREVRDPGHGAMLAFVMRGGAAAADAVCDRVQLAVHATSLGGVETTLERRQKYAGDSGVDPGLIRLSVGIEDPEDLWVDLHQALANVSS
jgi:cystathionine gamma-synthase